MTASCSKSDNNTIIAPLQSCTLETKAEAKPFVFPDLDWKQYDSYPDKVAALQVPEELLRSMNSVEIAEIVFDYPFLAHGFLYNDCLFGVGRVLDRFNAYKVLCEREDAYSSLLTAYKKRFPLEMEMSKLQRASIVDYSINMVLCAYVLCQDNVIPAEHGSALESLDSLADELQLSVEQVEELKDLSIMSIPKMLKDFAESKR